VKKAERARLRPLPSPPVSRSHHHPNFFFSRSLIGWGRIKQGVKLSKGEDGTYVQAAAAVTGSEEA
jgi:hypothetical protein